MKGCVCMRFYANRRMAYLKCIIITQSARWMISSHCKFKLRRAQSPPSSFSHGCSSLRNTLLVWYDEPSVAWAFKVQELRICWMEFIISSFLYNKTVIINYPYQALIHLIYLSNLQIKKTKARLRVSDIDLQHLIIPK